ncbi:MAG: hypothetical protein UDB11_08030 [Peptococcaceae bacterium]|nr:hypothetical protein [Peptococcaceae bacterium]
MCRNNALITKIKPTAITHINGIGTHQGFIHSAKNIRVSHGFLIVKNIHAVHFPAIAIVKTVEKLPQQTFHFLPLNARRNVLIFRQSRHQTLTLNAKSANQTWRF